MRRDYRQYQDRGYAEVVRALKPLVCYRLGDRHGTTARDGSGNGRTGTYTNTPTLGVAGLLTGDSDTAVDFDPASSEVLGTDAALPAITQRTLACWIKPDTADDGAMISIGSTAAYLRRLGTGALHMNFRDSGAASRAVTSAGGLLTAGSTYFVAGTHDGTTARVYINGTAVASDATWDVGATASAVWQVGRFAAASLHFPGVIDEAAIFDYALSSASLAALYAIGIGA